MKNISKQIQKIHDDLSNYGKHSPGFFKFYFFEPFKEKIHITKILEKEDEFVDKNLSKHSIEALTFVEKNIEIENEYNKNKICIISLIGFFPLVLLCCLFAAILYINSYKFSFDILLMLWTLLGVVLVRSIEELRILALKFKLDNYLRLIKKTISWKKIIESETEK